ncbi:hypothetical protein CPC08DRAFT_518402 [Agrocybe pediades]|nr:hypothetical protein CPC08DRAFT_518402 [Agrocybe pediades]
MSAREPLWFCHECHAEMRPLMVPDPVCASCHGSFVEKMENAEDDPREFAHGIGPHADDAAGMPPQGLDTILFTLQSLMDRGIRSPTQRAGSPLVTFEVRGPNVSRTVRLGGGVAGPRPDSPHGAPPNMSTFLGGEPQGLGGTNGRERPDISGALMAQYLMALLGQRDVGMFGLGPENGRMGDYVFNQEALDQIITQIMENSNAHRPVPAPEETIQKLPREVLEEGSRTLELDCAVCKEQFKIETEDPAEQIVVTLPCKHPFHEPCIVPWLKSSATCPVCRFALVPQPEHHAPPPRNPVPEPTGTSTRPRSPNHDSGPSNPTTPNRGAGGGLFMSIFGGLSDLVHNHGHHDPNSAPSTSSPGARQSGARSPTRRDSPNNSTSSQHRRSNSDPSSRSHSSRSPPPPPPNESSRPSGGNNNNNVPGGWADDLD